MPTLNSHTITHGVFNFNGIREPQAVCQAAQSQRTSQSLSKSVSVPPLTDNEQIEEQWKSNRTEQHRTPNQLTNSAQT